MVNAQIRLDTFRENNIPILKIPQGDYLGRELNVTVTSLGQKILLNAADGIVITASRPDGASKSFEGRVDALSGTAVVPISRWMLDITGDVECWVSVVRGESKYTTNSFLMEVQPGADYISSEDGDYTPSDQVIVEINARISALDDKLSNQELKLSNQETKLSNQELKLSNQETKLSIHDGKFIVLENKLVAQEGKLTAANSQISELEQDMTNANSQISELEQDMTNANSQISEHGDALGDHANELVSLGEALAALRTYVEGGSRTILNIDAIIVNPNDHSGNIVELPLGTKRIKCSGTAAAVDFCCFTVLDIYNEVIYSNVVAENNIENNNVNLNLETYKMLGASKIGISGARLNVGDTYVAGSNCVCQMTVECI